ncbi:hypothetical protein GCM10009541_35210 [Micromonospora gifhornensis]|uniref:Uncharacterized protein n=1 Tax=Micromonospora gifhornensis TaxID=84594 RepID=A0ABQ4IJN6_9ACTN|nr:hypothetical protein [Micromonospora gifhornensis]GIJ18117.1 hypothetical protein Vgi01_48010 [Micromonospora gifhornensis]
MKLVRILVVLCAALLFGQGQPVLPASAAPASPAPVRYWVVGEPRDGQREYLYQIAMLTLADGNRYLEILDLNRDRLQPDGGRLTDALTPLRPGWILELPPDAQGPGVRTGVPPVPQRSRPKTSTGGGVLTYLLPAVGVSVAVLVLGLLRRARRVTPASTPPMASVPATAGEPPSGSIQLITDLEPMTGEPGHRLGVRLLGADHDAGARQYAWLEHDAAPQAQLPVVLGHLAGRRLMLDLAAVPDILTITGRAVPARSLAIDLIDQLNRAGVTVVVVGDVLAGEAPAGTTPVPDFPAANTVVDQLPGPVVVVCGGLRGAQLAMARSLATRTRHRAVPMLVGEVIRARWSVTVNRVRSVTT